MMRDNDVIEKVRRSVEREIEMRRLAVARSFDFRWMKSLRGWLRFLLVALLIAIKGWVYILIALLGFWLATGADTGPVLELFNAMRGNLQK